MADLATLQTRLTEAETAYHALMTGTKVVSVGAGDDRVTYQATQAVKLASYIADLNQQISEAQGGAAVLRRAHARF